ncbi:GAF domain-containing protein [Amycolatopsis arida]|uniref:GAF domain-containing protein n=1 Tax=Amycolatopsis arida TaxID=587909 RepID=A0A1I5YLX8_9PSEU|nr:GAF and ANTAR domain-containing protein [Amycolatopsis arida]TDX90610.1 GAF domain-containing protein [Amycolatopsis arida]SFQ45162.1 GAF domain-containing protein [Amycolatopsis arida]
MAESPAAEWRAQVDEVTDALEALTRTLDHEEDLGTILRQVCVQITEALPDADVASITVRHGDTYETAASSNPVVLDIDAAQYRAGQGPCLEAIATGEVVRVDVSTAVEKWPDFAKAATEVGIRSYLAAPLTIDPELAGALNLFGYTDHGYHEIDAKLLELYSTAVEAAVRSIRRYLAARDLAQELRTALASRAVIDQAKGMLMAARHVSADEAFQLLVRQSQQQNVKLRELAVRLVTELSRP